ncbi:craniofacial development protein 2-like [Sitophilus oryzae]|uniref:Craniofacial development protein 2-like n=1 Tax=Sitophilus oryzae TaxID=7048 RepID=A0A6J2X7I1_SITOR|nr:craniofacial development protein 2-like [Sitophilus oryzae]
MDIVVLSETKKKGHGSENLGQKSLRRCITSWEPVSPRLIKMNLSLHGKNITIIGVYAVNDDTLVKDKEEFFEQLSYEISKIGQSREIILTGDLNSRIGKKLHDKIVGQFREATLNDNGNRLINICDQNNLRILNGFFQHRDISTPGYNILEI